MQAGTSSRPAAGGAQEALASPSMEHERWSEIQRLFERCRDRPRDEWHGLLRRECAGRDGVAFEVLTLLVAAEALPPIEDPAIGHAVQEGSGPPLRQSATIASRPEPERRL